MKLFQSLFGFFEKSKTRKSKTRRVRKSRRVRKMRGG